MSRVQQRRKALELGRTFEPGRLSDAWLAEAYERLVPRRTRVVRAAAFLAQQPGEAGRRRMGGHAT
jgi:hypothetical protein